MNSTTIHDENVLNCEICHECPSKYRCPKCGIHYCSVVCFQKHKENCVSTPYSMKKEEEKREDEEEDEEEQNEIADYLIPKEQLEKIKKSESIKELLNEPFIQKAIISIMSSDNKERTLNNLKNDSEFSLLIDELVLCVGIAKRREDGSIEFTGLN